MEELSAFQRDILFVIADLEMPYGMAIMDSLEGYYSEEVHHGRLYPNLDKLADRDLLSKGQIDRRTNSYQLTDKGESALEQRIEWEQNRLN